MRIRANAVPCSEVSTDHKARALPTSKFHFFSNRLSLFHAFAVTTAVSTPLSLFRCPLSNSIHSFKPKHNKAIARFALTRPSRAVHSSQSKAIHEDIHISTLPVCLLAVIRRRTTFTSSSPSRVFFALILAYSIKLSVTCQAFDSSTNECKRDHRPDCSRPELGVPGSFR